MQSPSLDPQKGALPTPDIALDKAKEKVASKQKEKFYRNRLLVLIFFLPVAFLGDHLIGSLLEYITLQSNFRYSRLYNGSAEADIVVLGNSRGHAFYEPTIEELTGASVFNLSYNALPVSLGKALLQDYFDRYKADVLVVDVSMLTKTEDKVIVGFKPYQVFSPRLQQLIKETSYQESMASQVSKLYNFNSEVFHRALYYLNKKDDKWILDKKISNSLIENAAALETVSFDFSSDRIRDLKEIIQLAKKNNAEVKLVIGPYYPEYIKKVKNMQEFIAGIEQHTGYKVHDYSALVSQDELFSDYLHLNKDGSSVFLQAMHADNVF